MKAFLNGTTLAWEETGQGKPLVLVHGLSEERSVWRYQVPAFRDRFRLIAVDVRGFGESALGEGREDARQFAEDLRALLDHLGIPQAVLWGFSMGGVIVQRFGVDFPERCQALVIASSSSRVGRSAVEWFRTRAERARREGLPAVQALNREDASGFFASAPPERVEEYIRLRMEAVRDPLGYANACMAMARLGEAPLDPDLPRIACPTLVFTGERDPMCPPRASEIIHRAIAGSRLAILPGLSHLAHWEDPDAVNRTVRAFLDEVL